MKQYLELLHNPPEEAKGWTRWWWYGCAVTKEEIDRELHFMHDAGLGGVEIQILYALAADDAEKGIRNIPYFSPEFFDVLRYTVEKAHALGMGVDFTLGSSWPYGGPFLPQDMAAQSVFPLQIDVTGPCKDYYFDFTTRVAGTIVRLVMGKMVNSRMVEDTVVDITDHLGDKELYGWPWGQEIRNLEIPEGDWKIVAFVVSKYHQSLVIPTRDAQGLVMDHCRQDVTDFFLKNAAQPLVDQLGKEGLRCIFCDSIELSGNNWTEHLPEEFARRRGYDLSPYLYALWGEVGDVSERLRYDYFRTMSELTVENFFRRLTQWCRERGLLCRIQAHGTWGDILQAYAAADIPEGETFGPQDKLFVNTIHRRLASSAGHIYGKPVISNESFTWLRVPRFLETMEQVKSAVDAIFLDGMNAIYNHGYAYSPEEAGTPGWAFYASSQLNHVNPSWDCYGEVARYIQRVSAMMRQGRYCNDVAIYLPQGDVWSENLLSDLHLGMKLQERFGWTVPDGIAKAGYSFDYVNDEALNDLASMDGGLKIGENTYRVLLLLACERIPVETARSLEKFVSSGGILLAAEQAPDRSCGFLDWKQNDETVREIMARIFPAERGIWKATGRGFAAVADDRSTALLELLREKRLPDCALGEHSDVVGYQHRKLPEGELYFLANISPEARRVTADFAVENGAPCVYDALRARPLPVVSWESREGRTRVTLELEPFGSAFVFFGQGLPAPLAAEAAEETAVTIPGPWKLEIPAIGFACTQDQPEFWQQYAPAKYFSGHGTYSAAFRLEAAEGQRVYLELEQLCDTARITVNGMDCGKLWKRPWRLDITDAVRAGENTVEIRCANQLINRALDPAAEPDMYPGTLVDGWPYFSETINQTRRRRIGLQRERDAIGDVQNAGLGGSVRLVLRRSKQ